MASCSSIRHSRTLAISPASVRRSRRRNENGPAAPICTVKERAGPDALARRLRRSGIAQILRVELSLGGTRADNRLGACGLIVVNPPWTLADELAIVLPELVAILSAGSGGAHRVDWVASEK